MRMLHTRIWDGLLGPIEAAIARRDLPVELAPLGSGPGDALLVAWSLSDEELAEAERAGVRWVQVLTVGLEDVLTPAVVASPVTVTTVGGVAARAIAELVLARILEHAKQLPHLATLQDARRWRSMLRLEALHDATLAVVGLGPVGRRIARIGRAFDMHLVAVRRRPEQGPGPCDEVAAPDDLRDVVSRSDYVVLAAPQTHDTVGLVDDAVLRAVKPGALLVNVARGPLIDEDALLRQLPEGRFRAALDVFREEPLPEDSPLWTAPGLRASPHCASVTPGLFDELADIAVTNIERFVAGGQLENVVDKHAGYPSGDPPTGAR